MKEKEEKPVWDTPETLFFKHGFTEQTQAHWRSQGKIPYHKVGKFIKYLESEIDEWIKEHKVTKGKINAKN